MSRTPKALTPALSHPMVERETWTPGLARIFHAEAGHLARPMTGSAELHSISIRENARTLRKFQERGVYAASAFLFRKVLWKKTRGSGLKPRAPLDAAPPRCEISGLASAEPENGK